MRSAPGATVRVVKPEEKQQILCGFIADSVTLDAVTISPNPVARVLKATLIAHSPASPVALALSSYAAAEPGVTLQLRAIFASVESSPAEAPGARPASASAAIDWVVLRQVTDVRLHDAHEQMVLDGSSTWVGDCLRRDPAKRDAYETYAPANPTATRWAELAFERIWALATPARLPKVEAAVAAFGEPGSEPGVIGTAPQQIDLAPTAMIATRH